MDVQRKLRTIKGWLSWRNDARAEGVFLINGAAALAAGTAAAVVWRLSLAAGVVIAAGTFGSLTASLFSPRTAVVATIVGSSVVGVVAGVVGAAFCGSGVAATVGGSLIGGTAFALTFLLYRGLVRSTTGAGELEGRYTGTFNERSESLRKGSGAAMVVVSATDEGDHDLRVTGLIVGGVPIVLLGVRREDETLIADLSKGDAAATEPFQLLRGKASVHEGEMLLVDLEGSPFGSYVFTGRRERG